MSEILTSLGLMSGTSMDGVDAAIIKTDGVIIKEMGEFITIPYELELRKLLKTAVATKKDLEEVEREVTVAHAEAVQILLQKSRLNKEDVDVIGFHGHTIDHRPDDRFTLQIGDGALLASLAGIDVVNDFRTADIKEGGQGAPLVPLFHQASMEGEEKPVAVLNIGGVANVTYLGADEIIAFDTGPGNALIDDWVFRNIGQNFDEDGGASTSGQINEEILKELVVNPYFSLKPPKSLDRDNFSLDMVSQLSFEDGAATLAAFTAETISMSENHFPEPPKIWYVTGGGRYNKRIMSELSNRLSGEVRNIESLGLNGDALEAQAFAYLAVRSLRKLPITLPSTTGIKKSSVTGGVFCPA